MTEREFNFGTERMAGLAAIALSNHDNDTAVGLFKNYLHGKMEEGTNPESNAMLLMAAENFGSRGLSSEANRGAVNFYGSLFFQGVGEMKIGDYVTAYENVLGPLAGLAMPSIEGKEEVKVGADDVFKNFSQDLGGLDYEVVKSQSEVQAKAKALKEKYTPREEPSE